MEFRHAALTDIGRKRAKNQDSYAVSPEHGLFVVADGMGGHRGGEIASALAASTVVDIVRQAVGLHDWHPVSVIKEAISSANHAIYDRSTHERDLEGMGTTTTALLFKDGTLTIGHVGDSRAYYFSKNGLWQLTRDHSLVQEKLRAGLISRSEVKTDQMKNVITRSVGYEENVDVETYEMRVETDDILLICSDGLTGLIDDRDISRALQECANDSVDPEKTVKNLVWAANARGGDDNITAILIEVLKT